MANRHGLEIRAATAADAAGLSALLETVGAPVTPRLLAERLEVLRQEPGAVLIAEAWGPPSGVIALAWRRTLQAEAPLAEITLLAVDPEERRQGIGRLLLKAASQAARLAGCSTIGLEASLGGPELQAFCLATGFSESGVHASRPLRKKG